MNLSKIAAALATAAVAVARDFTPHGKAIATLIAGVNEITGRRVPLALPNIEYFADADGDGIEDSVDADHGTVAAVTDEMLKAAFNSVEFTDWRRGEMKPEEFPMAAVYLHMVAARPKK